MKPLFSYYGGKQKMAKHIVPIIATIPHKIYVEPFAGSAAVFWAMPAPAYGHNYRAVLNDTNGAIANFYRVCRDRSTFEELLWMLEHGGGYSRALYLESREAVIAGVRGVEGAYHWFQTIGQGVLNKAGRAGWGMARESTNDAASHALKIDRLRAQIEVILARLSGVYIDEADAVKCITKWDHADALFYCDPPYVGTDCKGYVGNWGDTEQAALIEVLSTCKGSVVLSGYPNASAPSGWEKHEFEFTAGSANGRNGSGNGARVECVWIVRRGLRLKGSYERELQWESTNHQ